MRRPDLAAIRQERIAGERFISRYSAGVHPNPRFYKYYWWVFWCGSEVDGSEFLTDKYRLNTANAIAFMAELENREEPYWVYNRRVYRRNSGIPFNLNHPCWEGAVWAPAFEDDPDPIAPAPLAGHK